MAEPFVSTLSNAAVSTPVIEQSQRGGLQFLTFPLGEDTQAMLPISQLTEVLPLATGQVVPIPDMTAWVLGAYNWRGEILWIVDLGQFLGFAPLHHQTRSRSGYSVLISQSGSSRLGLAVSQVEDMHWCEPANIESPPTTAVTAELAPFLKGYTLSDRGEILLTLDAQAIFDRAQPDC
jgi:positive phototaxis protein PixI